MRSGVPRDGERDRGSRNPSPAPLRPADEARRGGATEHTPDRPEARTPGYIAKCPAPYAFVRAMLLHQVEPRRIRSSLVCGSSTQRARLRKAVPRQRPGIVKVHPPPPSALTRELPLRSQAVAASPAPYCARGLRGLFLLVACIRGVRTVCAAPMKQQMRRRGYRDEKSVQKRLYPHNLKPFLDDNLVRTPKASCPPSPDSALQRAENTAVPDCGGKPAGLPVFPSSSLGVTYFHLRPL